MQTPSALPGRTRLQSPLLIQTIYYPRHNPRTAKTRTPPPRRSQSREHMLSNYSLGSHTATSRRWPADLGAPNTTRGLTAAMPPTTSKTDQDPEAFSPGQFMWLYWPDRETGAKPPVVSRSSRVGRCFTRSGSHPSSRTDGDAGPAPRRGASGSLACWRGPQRVRA
jgi:hypothetical protein